MTDIIDNRIKDQTRQFMESAKGEIGVKEDKGRFNEQSTQISWALESVLGRVERGVTVEIRFIPPTSKQGDEPPTSASRTFAELKGIVSELAFPEVEGEPITKLLKPPVDQAIHSAE